MFDLLKRLLIRALRIPPEPEPPQGSAASLLVFRAAPGYLRYRLVQWVIGHTFLALLLIGASVALWLGGAIVGHEEGALAEAALKVGSALVMALLAWLVVFNYATLRLDYELRWYKVTDRSLRIREGVTTVKEKTMTFANIQNISLHQGPLQRWFGISDLMVRTAGGGASADGQQTLDQAVHVGYFKGIDNAEQVRELMLDRLRRYKDAGLGDQDDAQAHAEDLDALLDELRQEARAFGGAARALATRR
jgi:uncharacterized membrane protein YdbT with pleckstrin-like domain